jgi:hypothetical protein
MFIIKKHYVATEANPNFAGEQRTYYEGKAGQLLGDLYGTYPRNWEINEYGYKTYAAAMRGLKAVLDLANWEMGHGKWTITAEVIEA